MPAVAIHARILVGQEYPLGSIQQLHGHGLALRGISAAWWCDCHVDLCCCDISVWLVEFSHGIVFSLKKQEKPAVEPPFSAQ